MVTAAPSWTLRELGILANASLPWRVLPTLRMLDVLGMAWVSAIRVLSRRIAGLVDTTAMSEAASPCVVGCLLSVFGSDSGRSVITWLPTLLTDARRAVGGPCAAAAMAALCARFAFICEISRCCELRDRR